MAEYHYAEMRVADRLMHRFPCFSYNEAERRAQALITDLWPEDGSGCVWSFHHSAFWGQNDLGEGVMVNAVTYVRPQRFGTYVMAHVTSP